MPARTLRLHEQGLLTEVLQWRGGHVPARTKMVVLHTAPLKLLQWRGGHVPARTGLGGWEGFHS